MGFQANIPLGFRKEMSNVRNAQLVLCRERANLQETELEVSHQVAFAIRDVESNLAIAQTNFNRRMAAAHEVEAVQAAYDTGTVTLDVLLQAQRTLADAESNYYRMLVNYNESIAQVHFARVRCWSIMGSTWPKGLGRARRISTPAGGPGHATPPIT